MDTNPAPRTSPASSTGRTDRRRSVVVGNGTVGHELVRALVAADRGDEIVVLGEEPRPAYDRVRLSSYVATRDVGSLSLPEPEVYDHPDVDLRVGARATGIDRTARAVELEAASTCRTTSWSWPRAPRPSSPRSRDARAPAPTSTAPSRTSTASSPRHGTPSAAWSSAVGCWVSRPPRP